MFAVRKIISGMLIGAASLVLVATLSEAQVQTLEEWKARIEIQSAARDAKTRQTINKNNMLAEQREQRRQQEHIRYNSNTETLTSSEIEASRRVEELRQEQNKKETYNQMSSEQKEIQDTIDMRAVLHREAAEREIEEQNKVVKPRDSRSTSVSPITQVSQTSISRKHDDDTSAIVFLFGVVFVVFVVIVCLVKWPKPTLIVLGVGIVWFLYKFFSTSSTNYTAPRYPPSSSNFIRR